MKYQEWMLDDHNLDIRFEDEAVVINQQEQEVDSWRIFPLSSPPQVKCRAGNSASSVMNLNKIDMIVLMWCKKYLMTTQHEYNTFFSNMTG